MTAMTEINRSCRKCDIQILVLEETSDNSLLCYRCRDSATVTGLEVLPDNETVEPHVFYKNMENAILTELQKHPKAYLNKNKIFTELIHILNEEDEERFKIKFDYVVEVLKYNNIIEVYSYPIDNECFRLNQNHENSPSEYHSTGDEFENLTKQEMAESADEIAQNDIEEETGATQMIKGEMTLPRKTGPPLKLVL